MHDFTFRFKLLFYDSSGKKDLFTVSITAVLLISILHLISIFLETAVPFGLLYGPLTFMAFEVPQKRRRAKFHIICNTFLFIFFLVSYLLLYNRIPNESIANKNMVVYTIGYFLLMVLSLLAYSIKSFFSISKQSLDLGRKAFLVELLVYNVFVALLIAAILIQRLFFPWFGFGFDMFLLIETMQFLGLIVISVFLFGTFHQKNISSKVLHSGQAESPSSVNTIYEAKKAIAIISDPEVFCNPTISYSSLAEKTGLSKQMLGDLLNEYYKANFYHVIAKHRIDYAVGRLKQDPKIKIEALSDECGFNSKSSFNRYFKDFNGVTPKEFRDVFVQSEQTVNS